MLLPLLGPAGLKCDQLGLRYREENFIAYWEKAKPRFRRIRCTARTFLIACAISDTSCQCRGFFCQEKSSRLPSGTAPFEVGNPAGCTSGSPGRCGTARAGKAACSCTKDLRLGQRVSGRKGSRCTYDLHVKSRMRSKTGMPRMVNQNTSDVQSRLTMSVYSREKPSIGATQA